MCNLDQALLGFFYPPSLIGMGSGSKNKPTITKATKEADKIIETQKEQNKLANAVQSTEKLSQTEELQKKLAAQKIPLNTGTTGLSVGNSLSTGLNLGGY